MITIHQTYIVSPDVANVIINGDESAYDHPSAGDLEYKVESFIDAIQEQHGPGYFAAGDTISHYTVCGATWKHVPEGVELHYIAA